MFPDTRRYFAEIMYTSREGREEYDYEITKEIYDRLGSFSDYVGIEFGRKVPDKFEKEGFHATKSEFVDTPLIDELPLVMEVSEKVTGP